ncbi:MAG: 3-methyl-2-oxobutanoate dehydrogenase subunit VorB [Candidatus Omnitrophica bacterium]|nr:3-methyl-2-oxobutanoate dehydrogenase subunit VorB [Candidatus Omnitrophota bacterium]
MTKKTKLKYLITGNEACGEGAVKAGCKLYAGYPITPQNELTAYMSRRMEEEGRVFIQAESELSAINMVFGASAAGVRTMTSSSSPGISLKQEGISYLAGAELPSVIVNVMRGGPGLGNIAGSQGDYFQAVKGGGHGDYRLIVLAPASVQEMFDFTYDAFALADKYRIPVMILSDGIIGQMMEVLEYDEDIKPKGETKKPWALTGAKGRKAQHLKSLILGAGEKSLEAHNIKLQKKYKTITENEIKYELYNTDNAEIVFVAYGFSARIAKDCIKILKEKGINAGLLRPITLWPYPYEVIRNIDTGKTKFVVVEMSAGQMVEDVRLAVQDDTRVHFYGRMGGGVPDETEIVEIVCRLKKEKRAKSNKQRGPR